VQIREREVRRRVAAVDRRHDRDQEADEAADLDADAERKAPSLFSGLGRHGAEEDAPDGAGTPAPGRPEAADLERTQSLSALPDDEEDAERP
jgi:hypothetical protein